MMDRRLLYVVTTARYGSFTAAAERVGVTQSAITKSVADLERELGYLIFNRNARGVLLTEEGRSFVDRAGRILQDTQALMRGAIERSDQYAGILRVSVCPASLEWLLVNPSITLLKRHPSIRLNVAGGTFDKVIQQLRAGIIDVALGYEAAFQDQPDLRRDLLTPMQTSFFVRKGHPILECSNVTAADIVKYVIISASGSPPYDLYWRQIYEETGVDVFDRMHIIDYFPLTEKLVRETDAIGSVSIQYAETSAFQSRFACVQFPWALSSPPLCCATRLRFAPRPAARAFIKACREHYPFNANGRGT